MAGERYFPLGQAKWGEVRARDREKVRRFVVVVGRKSYRYIFI